MSREEDELSGDVLPLQTALYISDVAGVTGPIEAAVRLAGWQCR